MNNVVKVRHTHKGLFAHSAECEQRPTFLSSQHQKKSDVGVLMLYNQQKNVSSANFTSVGELCKITITATGNEIFSL